MAEVTKRHRELALMAVFNLTDEELSRMKNTVMHWVQTGAPAETSELLEHYYDELDRVAKAIADAEERGTPGAQHRAWTQGYAAGARDAVDLERGVLMYVTKNPYPAE